MLILQCKELVERITSVILLLNFARDLMLLPDRIHHFLELIQVALDLQKKEAFLLK